MRRSLWHRLQPYALALILVVSTAGLLLPFRTHLNTVNIALLFLIVLALLSLRVDTGAGIVASIIAFLCFNALFIPPYYTFSVARPEHGITLFAFLGIAVLITQLVMRIRRRTVDDLRRGRQTASLYSLSSALISQISVDDVLTAVVRRVHTMFALDSCLVLLDEHGDLVPRASVGEPLTVPRTTLGGLAHWVMETRQLAGVGSPRTKLRPPTRREQPGHPSVAQSRHDRTLLLVPIGTARRSLGVLAVARRQPRTGFTSEEAQLLETFANQAAIAIERSLLTEEQTRAEILARSDELKSALLSAVSHDLRTPLASIKAAATSLLQPGVQWVEADRRELLEAIDEEADRLNQLVANLLELSRIESGALQPEFAWYDLIEVVYEAVRRTEAQLRAHVLQLDLPADLPTLWLDFIEIVQVLVNLLENAAKYAPTGTRVVLSGQQVDGAVEIVVRDQGVGIPPGEEERIFDKFYRVEAPRRLLGSGVGLAICRGFVEAHGGRIWAVREPNHGLAIHFTLPLVTVLQPVQPTPVTEEAPL